MREHKKLMAWTYSLQFLGRVNVKRNFFFVSILEELSTNEFYHILTMTLDILTLDILTRSFIWCLVEWRKGKEV